MKITKYWSMAALQGRLICDHASVCMHFDGGSNWERHFHLASNHGVTGKEESLLLMVKSCLIIVTQQRNRSVAKISYLWRGCCHSPKLNVRNGSALCWVYRCTDKYSWINQFLSQPNIWREAKPGKRLVTVNWILPSFVCDERRCWMWWQYSKN